jgi:prepilin-type N-terminal cleavage/methylation domain-containing protein
MKKQRSAFTLVEILIVIVIIGMLAMVAIPLMTKKAPEETKTIKVTTSKMEAYYDFNTLESTSDISSFNEDGETIRFEWAGIGFIEIGGLKEEELDKMGTTAEILAVSPEINLLTPEELTAFAERRPIKSNSDGKTVIKMPQL